MATLLIMLKRFSLLLLLTLTSLQSYAQLELKSEQKSQLNQQTSEQNRQEKKLTVGITLQPYYSYVKAVVGDQVNVLPLVDEGFNPPNLKPMICVV